MRKQWLPAILIWTLLAFQVVLPAMAHAPNPDATPAELHDGQHDFDFQFGTWKIHLKRLLHPLTGSTTWVEFDCTTATRKPWDGRADIEQFETTSSASRIEGLTLRLYNPSSHQWSIYWARSEDDTLGIPTIGEFKNGQGELYDRRSSRPNDPRPIHLVADHSKLRPLRTIVFGRPRQNLEAQLDRRLHLRE